MQVCTHTSFCACCVQTVEAVTASLQLHYSSITAPLQRHYSAITASCHGVWYIVLLHVFMRAWQRLIQPVQKTLNPALTLQLSTHSDVCLLQISSQGLLVTVVCMWLLVLDGTSISAHDLTHTHIHTLPRPRPHPPCCSRHPPPPRPHECLLAEGAYLHTPPKCSSQ